MNSSDVIVVGAGIGGAVLALALGTRGWKVTLLEREAEAPRIVRPEVLWGATPAALDSFGVGDVIRNQTSIRLDGVAVCRGSQRLLTLTHNNLRTARVEAYSTDPGQTRAVIAAAAAATGNVTFLRGVEVQQVVREGNRVVGVQAHREGRQLMEQARLVVGDDGAKSVVRGALSPESDLTAQAGHTRPEITLNIFPLDFITAAVAWPSELPTDQARVWINPQAFHEGIPAVGCLPWPKGRGVLLMPLPHARAVALLAGTAEAFWSELARVTPLAAALSQGLAFPTDFHRVQRPYGHAPQYVANGAAIIGDAAHPVSPAGGQGANASIWDALTLAEVAHEALSVDDMSRERLARYEALRRPRNRDSVRITQRVVGAFQCASCAPGLPWLVPALLRCLDLLPHLKSHIVSSFATTFVTRGKA